jgi:hypothetical protein
MPMAQLLTHRPSLRYTPLTAQYMVWSIPSSFHSPHLLII